MSKFTHYTKWNIIFINVFIQIKKENKKNLLKLVIINIIVLEYMIFIICVKTLNINQMEMRSNENLIKQLFKNNCTIILKLIIIIFKQKF